MKAGEGGDPGGFEGCEEGLSKHPAGWWEGTERPGGGERVVGKVWTDASLRSPLCGIRLNSACFRVLQTKGVSSHQPDSHLKKGLWE